MEQIYTIYLHHQLKNLLMWLKRLLLLRLLNICWTTLTRTINDHRMQTKQRLVSYTYDETNYIYLFFVLYTITKETCWINLIMTVLSPIIVTSRGFY